MLKSELRNMERSQKREGVDMTYLKNVILKLLETGNTEKVNHLLLVFDASHFSIIFLILFPLSFLIFILKQQFILSTAFLAFLR